MLKPICICLRSKIFRKSIQFFFKKWYYDDVNNLQIIENKDTQSYQKKKIRDIATKNLMIEILIQIKKNVLRRLSRVMSNLSQNRLLPCHQTTYLCHIFGSSKAA